MDTAREIARLLGERRGIVIVIVAVCMVLILFFMGLAIDLSFRHVARTELQNAAEAAALAGATKLPDLTAARAAAVQYATLHKAAGDSVDLATSDVTLGNYDPDRPAASRFVAGGGPTNAVQVQARRTEEGAAPQNQGKVPLFFSTLFGYPSIAVSGIATAQRQPHANGYFTISSSICVPPPGTPAASILPSVEVALTQSPADRKEVVLAPSAVPPAPANMAWTALTQVVSGSQISTYICSDVIPDVEVAPGPVYTTNGMVAQTFEDLEGSFFDLSYDRTYKTLRADGTMDTWTVIVPVTSEVDPTNCSSHECGLWGYAKVLITRVCGAGAGRACRNNRPPPGRCSGGESDIVISGITCAASANTETLVGRKAYLVKNNGE